MREKKGFFRTVCLMMAMLLVFLSIPAQDVAAANEAGDTVHVIVENTNFENENFYGKMEADVKVTSGMTMMEAIVQGVGAGGGTIDTTDGTYISSINGLEEKAAKGYSGWMGTLNGWFTHMGFHEFKVEAGDEIRVMYTVDGGPDVGIFREGEKADNTLLDDITFSEGVLTPEFSADTKEYILQLPDDVDSVMVNPSAVNKNYQVRVYKGDNYDLDDKEGRPHKNAEAISVMDEDVVTVISGYDGWPRLELQAQEVKASVYTFTIKSNITKNTAPKITALPGAYDRDDLDLASENETDKKYSIDLSQIFSDDDGDTLTYTVSVDGAEEQAIEDTVYEFAPKQGGMYQLMFRASDGRAASEAYTVNVVVKDGKEYKIQCTSDMSDGKVTAYIDDTEITSAKVGDTVKLVAYMATGGSEPYTIRYLNIVDDNGKNIKKDIIKTEANISETGTNPYDEEKPYYARIEYTFKMPAQDVSVKAEWDYMNLLRVYSTDTTFAVKMKIFNDKEEEIFSGPFTGSRSRRKIEVYLTDGTYKYELYGKRDSLVRAGQHIVDNKSTLNVIDCHLSVFSVNISNGSSFLENYQHGIKCELWTNKGDEDESITQFYYENVDTGTKPREGYKKIVCVYWREDEGGLKYKLSLVDSRLTLINYSGTDKREVPLEGTVGVTTVGYDYNNCHLSVKNAAFVCKAPKEANFRAYTHPGVAYKAWEELTPKEKDTESSAEYDIYTFEVIPGEISVVAGGDGTDYVKTYARYNVGTSGMTDAVLQLDKKGTVSAHSDVANNIYTNIAHEGSYLTLNLNDVRRLEAFRTFQTVENNTTNRFIEPEMYFERIYGDSVEISGMQGSEGREYVNLTAVKEGVSVIQITYDEVKSGRYNYDSINPVHTGIVIVNVGGSEGAIKPDISQKKYDTIYFTGKTIYPDGTEAEGKGHGTYTFKPTADGTLKVETHKPLHTESDKNFADNWKEWEKDADGNYVIDVYDGRNIIKITSGESESYFVLNARETDVTITNVTTPGKMLSKGDIVSVAFSNLELPVQKMTAIYNPGFPSKTWLEYKLNGETVEGEHTQYDIEKNNTILFKAADSGTYVLSDGFIHAEHLGSRLDAHCDISEDGMAPNFNAGTGANSPNFCTLPQVEIPVGISTATAVSSSEEAGTVTAEKIGDTDDGSQWKLTAAPKEGYEFVGWALQAEPDKVISTEPEYTVTIWENTAYIGLFKEKAAVTFTVTFDANEHGTAPEALTGLTQGSKVARPADPAAEGYTFTGWYVDKECQTPWNFDEGTVQADMTLYAGWEKIPDVPEDSYAVVFQMNGHGTAPESLAVKKGEKITEPAAPKADGYEFLGWYKDEACTLAWDFSQDIVTENTTLYAKWSKAAPVLPGQDPDDDHKLVIEEIEDMYYTGSALKPTVNVYGGGTLLTAGKDYKVKYFNNVDADANGNDGGICYDPSDNLYDFDRDLPYVLITGKGNYGGTYYVNFHIRPVSLEEADEEGSLTLKYTEQFEEKGKDQKIISSLKYKKALKLGTDYEVRLIDNGTGKETATAVLPAHTPAGRYTLAIAGLNRNFTGTIERDLVVADKAHLMKNAKITLKGTVKKGVEYERGGVILSSSTGDFEVKMKGVSEPLTEDTDYKVSYVGNDRVGIASLVITGEGDYYGSKSVKFKITGKAFATNKIGVQLEADSKPYTGAEVTQDGAVLTYDGQQLSEGVEYEVSYKNNIKKGTASMIFKALPESGYSGQYKTTFKITPAVISNGSDTDVDLLNQEVTAVYAPAGAKPKLVLANSASGIPLKEGTDYTVKYKNNKKVTDAASLTITGKGNYTGSIQDMTFTVEPKDLTDEDITVTPKGVALGNKPSYTPKVQMLYGKAKVKSAEYTVDYQNTNTKGQVEAYLNGAGAQPMMAVKAKEGGNYTGSVELPLAVYNKKLTSSNLYVEVERSVYTGSQIRPQVNVWYGSAADVKAAKAAGKPGDNLTQLTAYDGAGGGQYMVTYGANVKAGKKTGSVTIIGLGTDGYGGSVTVKFQILPKAVGTKQ